jgi:hypothetical protein
MGNPYYCSFTLIMQGPRIPTVYAALTTQAIKKTSQLELRNVFVFAAKTDTRRIRRSGSRDRPNCTNLLHYMLHYTLGSLIEPTRFVQSSLGYILELPIYNSERALRCFVIFPCTHIRMDSTENMAKLLRPLSLPTQHELVAGK